MRSEQPQRYPDQPGPGSKRPGRYNPRELGTPPNLSHPENDKVGRAQKNITLSIDWKDYEKAITYAKAWLSAHDDDERLRNHPLILTKLD